jgi:pyruvate dehydrogenase E1 component alpha subunit
MKTYRYRGHSRSDPAKYRPAGELDAWKARDPIEILGARLVDAGEIAAGGPPEIRQEIEAEIDAAAERAASAPYPTLEETRPYVYAD